MVLVDTTPVVPVSVTGNFCPMNCKHCGGVYLKHMIPVQKMEEFAKDGRKIFLISGGITKDGRIPFDNHYILLKTLKEKYNLRYNFHIGFPLEFPEKVDELADVVSADFYADPEVLKEVYGIERSIKDQLDIITSFKKPVVPHITIGVLCGKITHEYRALDILSDYFSSIVLNVFIPTRGTFYENCPPPDIEEAEKIFRYARRKFKAVFLGCMQPKGSYRTKLQRKLSFIDGITKPVLEKANTKNCCAFEVIQAHHSIF
ncbi:MAG: radical SAM protein [Thermotogaceae bacterium]|nr:radical SAM protein [Thermotogaceae bacterium]